MEIKKITLNELFQIEPIFHNCFCCGSKDHTEIYIKDHLFRLCKICEKREDVILHFRTLIRGNPHNTSNVLGVENENA